MNDLATPLTSYNLVLENFHRSAIFKFLSGVSEIYFKGEAAPKCLRFQIQHKEVQRQVIMQSLIRGEEDALWESCRQLIDQSLKLATGQMKGFYGFELLTADLDHGIRNFVLNDFAALLANHARKLEVGDSRLIQYGGFFGKLSKRVEEDWGKLEWKHFILIYRADPPRLDLIFKKMLSLAKEPEMAWLLLQDLSAQAIFDLKENEEQKNEWQKFCLKHQKVLENTECFLIHANKLINLKTVTTQL